jgi:hypothetical protein
MERKKYRRRAIFAGAALASLLSAAPLKAEPMVNVGVNSFAGSHQKEGTIIGGGISIALKDNISLSAKLDIASKSLEKPVLYSYGVYLGVPFSQSISGNAYCRKDGVARILGCGGGASLQRGILQLGAGGECRPDGTITVKSSLSAKFKAALLKIKARVLGFINTKKDSKSGGTDIVIELSPLKNLSVFARYNLVIKTDEEIHAGVGGVQVRTDL